MLGVIHPAPLFDILLIAVPNHFVFMDEAGCFTFNRNDNVSRYFVICTVMMNNCDVGDALVRLRRELAWEGAELGDFFHATTDRQSVRDRVYDEILQYDFTVQATIMEKSKAQPQVRTSKPTFYKYGCFYHFKHGIARNTPDDAELLVTTASVGTNRERRAFETAVSEVLSQTHRGSDWRTNCQPSQAEPCLQVADYCAWAIQRKLERDDDRSYALIEDRINYEYDLWANGTVHHY